jgi:glycerol-3-phosphate dehydrogenase
MSDPAASYDVVVIGAGVNGAGIARDAALRGMSVIVLDQNDLCSGTSAISSRLIHGGLRADAHLHPDL